MYYNSWDERYKKPFGACSAESKVCFSFNADETSKVNLIIYNDVEKIIINMEKKYNEGNIYECKWIAPKKPGLWWYYFEIKSLETVKYYGNNIELLGGEGKEYEKAPLSYQLTLYKKDIAVPNWYKKGIIYQIFVDRFFNGSIYKEDINPRPSLFIKREWNEKPQYVKDKKGNIIKYDYFGGNIRGIIEKLPFLKLLGVSIIYLNPVFEAWSNHKYDTGDYMKIDNMYGDEIIFSRFIDKCREQGISVILDGVFNHTGRDSIYFNSNNTYDSIGAYNSKESPYYEWYMFNDYPEDYKSWWGIKNLPVINKDNEDYRDFIMRDKESVIHHWMKHGVKGWRLDVADELTDDFVSEFRKEVKGIDEESIILGEVWEDASNKISYGVRRKYLLGEELDSVMNYPFRNIVLSYVKGEISGEKCLKRFMSLRENYPEEYFYSTMNLLGSHDVPRLLTELGVEKNYNKAVLRLKMAVLFQMTFPGVPSIYYGDEAGLTGGTDPENRRTYPWGRENGEIFSWYKYLCNLRCSIPELVGGRWKLLYGNSYIFAYIRYSQKEQYIILYNNDEVEHTISIPLYDFSVCNKYIDLISEKIRELISDKLVISIDALNFRILKFKN